MSKIYARLIAVILTVLMFFSLTSIHLDAESYNDNESVRQAILSDSGIIRIKNDTHLIEMAAEMEWDGKGSSEDPFIIQGYEIDAQGEGSALHVGNTSLHLHIKDSTFHNASRSVDEWHSGASVTLYKATNITLQNNNCSHSRYGILIDRGYNNRIIENILQNNRFRGLDIDKGGNNTVSNNQFFDKDGLLIRDSIYNIFYSNEFNERGFSIEGVREIYVGQVISKNNTVKGKPICYYKNINGEGLALPSSTGQVIFGNVTNIIIEGLEISHSTIIVGYSFNITISENTISQNPAHVGISAVSSENITIRCNSLSNNLIGISLHKTSDSFITENIMRDSIQEGILLDKSNNVEIIGNTLDRCGIRMESSDSNRLANNLIFKNAGFGIGIETGSNNVIHSNALLYNNRARDVYNSSHIQAHDDSTENNWNSTSGHGNYWRDWTGPDEDQDEIVDEPYDIFGSGSYDNFPLAEPPMPILPDKPRDLSLNAGNGEMNINWTMPLSDGGSGIEGYRVYRKNISDDSESIFIVEGMQTTSLEDIDVSNGITYSYQVAAFNAIGEGLPTDTFYGEPDGTPPSLTIEFPGNNSHSTEQKVEVIWNHSDENSGVSHSEIRVNDGNWTDVERNTTHTLSDLHEGEHRVYVRTYDNAGNHITKWVMFNIDITPPTIVSHSPTDDDVPVDFEIIIEFSEPMNTNTVNVTIPSLSLTPIQWINNTIAITEPTKNTTHGKMYRVFVTGKDAVGHSLGTYIWQFNTTDKGVISGYVVDRDGEPIQDVNVSLSPGNYVFTDDSGHFTMTASQGTHTLSLYKQGYEDKKMIIELKAGEINELNTISLQPVSSRSDWILIIVSLSIVVSGILAFGLFMIRLEKRELGEFDEEDIIDEETDELPPEFLE